MDQVKAVIFDMDGVLIDSEKFWKQAESEVFSSLGVNVLDEFTALTKSMTTKEVTRFWYKRFPWLGLTLNAVEEKVVRRVMELIKTENCEMKGIKTFIESLHGLGFKIGLATNSPSIIIPVVLNKLGIAHYFNAVTSAEEVPRGKPDPAVYELTANKLQVDPKLCIAIEDSYSGILAAKSAGMKTAAYIMKNTFVYEADLIMNAFNNENRSQLTNIFN
ncbi:hexitol phosphatase HxpB [Chryseobacterium wangxinyae]|uniref:hexitol phosphatase HxpB n=1 Tax=Chryseobacterium sp. CY350 TaxID=2997336 RepID=UPI0022718B5F|nr:hexitol phosphatase HxpB [Chryseobacterium sp. CY350]MCY0977299.1 hexitol phosphatase HxpB [Chryseobacterium sp. CY350]WBZ95682.1 hexitol phosphatase HxpB [Chryseobacterium sp. CY350]